MRLLSKTKLTAIWVVIFFISCDNSDSYDRFTPKAYEVSGQVKRIDEHIYVVEYDSISGEMTKGRGSKPQTVVRFFDLNNNISKTVYYLNMKPVRSVHYYYNIFGNYEYKINSFTPSTKSTILDSDKNKMTEIRVLPGGNSNKITYYYNKKGENYRTKSFNNNTPLEDVTIKFNSKGHPIKQIKNKFRSGKKRTIDYFYKSYDEKGNWTERVEIIKRGKNNSTICKKRFIIYQKKVSFSEKITDAVYNNIIDIFK